MPGIDLTVLLAAGERKKFAPSVLPGAHLERTYHSASSSPQSVSPVKPYVEGMYEEEEEEEEEYTLKDLDNFKYKNADDLAYEDPGYYSLIPQ